MDPQLPPSETPLNQHSLIALEFWLNQLGAVQSIDDPCKWSCPLPDWTTEIEIGKEDLRVTWIKDGYKSKCLFSYGLSREDVQLAIDQGP